MFKNEFEKFSEMFGDVASMYNKTMSTTQTAMYFRVLAQYPIEAIQAALDAHICSSDRGRFMPMPADLIGQLETMRFDGRPSAEEAWSVAVQSIDEDLTIVWTQETQDAWAASARELMAIGDKFNASRGFIGKYNELVAMARRNGIAVKWLIVNGYNKDLREQVIRQAYKDKKITQEYARILLPYHTVVEGVYDAIQSNVSHMIENKGASIAHHELSRVEQLKTAAEAHQQRLADLHKAIGVSPQQPKKRNAFECLAIFEQAEAAQVFISREDKKHWLDVASQAGDMRELQQRMLAKRGAA